MDGNRNQGNFVCLTVLPAKG